MGVFPDFDGLGGVGDLRAVVGALLTFVLIVAELNQVTRRIDAHFGDYADARAHLDDTLGLLANCADIYTRCDDTNRRLCNQAFFTKVFIDEDNELRVEHNRPFEMLLDPQINANALTWAADANKGRTSTNVSVGKGSSLVRAVDLRGLEPLTPCMPCRCATSCATGPEAPRLLHQTWCSWTTLLRAARLQEATGSPPGSPSTGALKRKTLALLGGTRGPR